MLEPCLTPVKEGAFRGCVRRAMMRRYNSMYRADTANLEVDTLTYRGPYM